MALALAVLSWWAVRTPETTALSQARDESSTVAGDIPQEPPAYQPRDALLALLRKRSLNSPAVCIVHAVTGMRGVGKTQLAAAFARQCIVDRWRLIAWINADSPATTLDGLAEAAAALGIPRGDDQDSAAQALRHHLETTGDNCLIVFDNAADPDGLRPYLPAAGHSQIIITSTHHATASLGTSVPVDVFTDSEALTFLTQRTGIIDKASARELAIELGYLPLALAQAAAAIASQRVSYQTYLDRLRVFPLGHYLTRPSNDPYPLSVGAAALLSLQIVQGSDPTGLAIPLMQLIAFLSPAGVPRELLYAAAARGTLSLLRAPDQESHVRGAPAAEIDVALGHLTDASLLTYSLDGIAVMTHRLTGRLIRERAAHRGATVTMGAAVINFLLGMTRQMEPTWQHVRVARDLTWQITAVNTHLSSVLDGRNSGIAEDLLRLRRWEVECLNQVGENPAHAIDTARAVAADHKRTLGPVHSDTLLSRHNLAIAYRQGGRLTEAIDLNEQLLVEWERILGSDHRDTLTTRSELALCYREAGRLAEAIGLFEQTLADRERVLGQDDPGTLGARANLATAYRDAGRPEALPLFERAYADLKRVLGGEHPHTLTARNNLGGAYQIAGRTTEAIPLHEETLTDRERILGQDHPDTLESRINLAAAYRVAGRLDEAVRLCERTLANCERVLGQDHPNTLATQDNLADIYQDAGRLQEAIALREKTLAACERVFGQNHPITPLLHNSLADAYQQAGRLNEAIQQYEQALADRERLFGSEHPDTLLSRSRLADARQKAGSLRAKSKPSRRSVADASIRVLRRIADFGHVRR